MEIVFEILQIEKKKREKLEIGRLFYKFYSNTIANNNQYI